MVIDMNNTLHEDLQKYVRFSRLAACILSAEKNPDGSCGTIRFVAVNEPFKRNFYSVFDSSSELGIKYESFDEHIIGKPYDIYIPKEPKFDDIVFRAAWGGEFIHTYVDTTKLYGYWTEDFLSPISCEHEDNVRYCQFMFRLNKEMEPSVYADVSPDISSFIVKTCLRLRDDSDYLTTMKSIARDIREYTNSFTAAMISINPSNRTFDIICEDILNNAFSVKEIFNEFSYDLFDTWNDLLKDTNIIIIKDENDMQLYEEKAPQWVFTLRRDNVKSLCLVPLSHQKQTIGFLYIANFDISEVTKIKECIELISFFLSPEIAHQQK